MTLLRVSYDDAKRTALVRNARHPEPAIVFDHRLECVLDGIEAQARRRI
jgi:hypothetical protein